MSPGLDSVIRSRIRAAGTPITNRESSRFVVVKRAVLSTSGVNSICEFLAAGRAVVSSAAVHKFEISNKLTEKSILGSPRKSAQLKEGSE